MVNVLMPKATALWLIRNTKLTFKQIGDFCGFHDLQVMALANGVERTLRELDPVIGRQLTAEEIRRCEQDPSLSLRGNEFIIEKKKKKYTPLSKRAEVPNAVLWVLKNFPHVPDIKVAALLGTTKTMVKNVREDKKYHHKDFLPKDPVILGICSFEEMQQFTENFSQSTAKKSFIETSSVQ